MKKKRPWIAHLKTHLHTFLFCPQARNRGVTGLPDKFPIQQKDKLFWKAIFLMSSQKQPSLLLNGEVIWPASDSYGRSKEELKYKFNLPKHKSRLCVQRMTENTHRLYHCTVDLLFNFFAVWPDLVKFGHFGKSLQVSGKFLTVWANFHCCNSPNIEK